MESGGAGVLNPELINAGLHGNISGGDYDSWIRGLTDDALLYVDAGTDRIGIGTAAPDEKLHVVGNLKVTGSVSGASFVISGLTASRIVATDVSKNLVTLDTATYPSLTELAYVKGVTSALQTQIDGKQPLDATLTALAGLNSTAGVLVQTGADAFTKRTLIGTADQVNIANGDGVSGNPTFSLPQSIATSSTPTFGALTVSNAAGAVLTITSTSAGNAVANLILNSRGTEFAFIRFSNQSVTTWDIGSASSAGALDFREDGSTSRMSIAVGGTITIPAGLVLGTASTPSSITLYGNGSATAKFVRIESGSFQILNGAFSSIIFSLNDTGTLGLTTAINGGYNLSDGTTTGVIYASGQFTNSLVIGTTSNHPLVFGTNNVFTHVVLTATGNLVIGGSAAGSNAVKVLGLSNAATAPTNSTDLAQLYCSDISAGNAVLAWFQEMAPYAGVAVASTTKIPVKVNGTALYILATTVA